jgi:signal transduction histidine kinase
MNAATVRQLPLFAGLSDDAFADLLRMAEPKTFQPGEALVEEGTEGDCIFVTLSGRFEVLKRAGERELVIAGRGPGELIGELAIVEGSARTATVRALEQADVLKISRETFEQVLLPSPGVAHGLLKVVMERLRNTEQMLKQNEKMAALGTLAAGLAHELNNPAAAVKRGASGLVETLAELQHLSAELAVAGMDRPQIEILNQLRHELPGRATNAPDLDPLARSDMEAELAGWLDEQQVENSWDLAPAIVALGWTPAQLETRLAPFGAQVRPKVLCWLATASAIYSLVDEIGQGAERISDIVRAVKSYSYLDQAPIQLVDVHEGLENTLVILRHKLKHGITVHRSYKLDLPRIQAYASELNQVWTNIIDNAIDAMGGQGDIWITTCGSAGTVAVEIANNGPEIPPEVQARIFEAFFTTKEPGKGTGLGLNITYNIIANQHHGDIRVTSDPDRTAFVVTLPIELKQ